MTPNSYRIILLIFFNTVLLSQMIASKTMYALSIEAYFNKNYLKEYSARINPGNASLDITIEIQRNCSRDPWIRFIFNQKIAGIKKPRKLFQYDANACVVLSKGQNKFLNGWVQNFLRYGNLPKRCPFLQVSVMKS